MEKQDKRHLWNQEHMFFGSKSQMQIAQCPKAKQKGWGILLEAKMGMLLTKLLIYSRHIVLGTMLKMKHWVINLDWMTALVSFKGSFNTQADCEKDA